MNEVEFIEFLNSCVEALRIAKGINLEIRSVEKKGEKTYLVLFADLDAGKRFEIDFYWPIVEKININTEEEKIRNGKLVVRKIYQIVRLG